MNNSTSTIIPHFFLLCNPIVNLYYSFRHRKLQGSTYFNFEGNAILAKYFEQDHEYISQFDRELENTST